jgi:hypothetical protein
MKKLQKVLCLTFILAFGVVSVAFARSQPPPPRGKSGAQPQQKQQEGGILVGRIAHVEGDLLRYVPEEQDWVAAIKDTPFGLEDALYSDENVKAEFIMPNGTWVRIGGSSQIQMIRLEDDITETDVASGIARFYNKSSSAVFKVTTPFGYVMAPAQSIFDLYVGDESLEIVAIKGSVDFVHIVGDTRYEVVAGEASILADGQQVASGEGTVDEDWDAWNAERDSVWAKRVEVRGDSVKYVPEPLQDESYVLEEQGKWEEVEYEGARRRFWRPTHVEADWVPYSRGHWVDYYGDQNWVPEEEEDFGYVTHHYGNWVYANTGWYWAPPVVSVGIGVPFVGVGWGWWPGRVGWIHSDVDVGWFPLAWHEPWYTHHYWGGGGLLVGGVGFAGVGIGIGSYAFANHAVIVNQNNFFARNYNNVRITNINQTIINNNFKTAHVVNNNVVKNYNTNKNRFNATDKAVGKKPHTAVVDRINKNKTLAKQDKGLHGKNLEKNVSGLKKGQLASKGKVGQPKLSNKLVAGDQVHKPKSDVKFQEKGLKTKGGVKPKTPHELATGKAGGIKSPRGDLKGKGKGGAVGGEGVSGSKGKRGGTYGGEGVSGSKGKGKGGAVGGEGVSGSKGKRGGTYGGEGVSGSKSKRGGTVGGEGVSGSKSKRGGAYGGEGVSGSKCKRGGGEGVSGSKSKRGGGAGAVGGAGGGTHQPKGGGQPKGGNAPKGKGKDNKNL